jgi:hypothetical protein
MPEVAQMSGPRQRRGPQRGTAGPCGSLQGGDVTRGGRWPTIDGELLGGREAVGVVPPPSLWPTAFL